MDIQTYCFFKWLLQLKERQLSHIKLKTNHSAHLLFVFSFPQKSYFCSEVQFATCFQKLEQQIVFLWGPILTEKKKELWPYTETKGYTKQVVLQTESQYVLSKCVFYIITLYFAHAAFLKWNAIFF